MSDYYCNICYKTMKLKSKRKHLTSKSHLILSKQITIEHQFNNLNKDEIIDKLKKHINELERNLYFLTLCVKLKIILKLLQY